MDMLFALFLLSSKLFKRFMEECFVPYEIITSAPLMVVTLNSLMTAVCIESDRVTNHLLHTIPAKKSLT